ncbi:MAG: protein-ADP-ribose hydrolase [Muribaculaceae bacterium]
MKDLEYVLRTLLDERMEYAGLQIPDSLPEQRRMMRALLNVRPPYPVNEDLIKAQDRELQRQLSEKGIVALSDIMPCRVDERLRLWQGDITRLQVDAIVNAANSALLGCFVPMHRCIDNAIHSAAGVQLRLACDRLMQAQGHPEPTGRAKITDGYNLPARYVLHTVGPIVRDAEPTPRQEQQLADCYRSCLALADAHDLQSIAFCCISTGEFGFPQRRAAEIAVSTVRAYLDATVATGINSVIFNVFKDDDLSIYRNLLS